MEIQRENCSSVQENKQMASTSQASLRWRLLRHYLLSKRGCVIEEELTKVSRRPNGHFGVITYQTISSCKKVTQEGKLEQKSKQTGNFLIEYDLPASSSVKLVLLQKQEDGVDLTDFTICQEHQIDNTGIVGLWPAEEILTYFCISHPDIFRSKRIVELGSGYGLAGLAIAACTDAVEVVLTDGNPQVVDYVEQNIKENLGAFGETKVRASLLRWCRERSSTLDNSFDVVIAADCTFFQASHHALAHTVKSLLRRSKDCQAFFFNPRRAGSLNSFVQVAKGLSLNVEVVEQYDDYIWNLHQKFLEGHNTTWPNYDPEHCYPLLMSITHADLESVQQCGHLS